MVSLAVSCDKEFKESGAPEEKAGNTVCFTATSEGAVVKTSIENGDGNSRIVKWTNGDKIDLLWAGGSDQPEAAVTGDGTTADFEAVIDTPASAYYAVYPAGVGSLATDPSEVLSITIPAIQDGSFANSNIAVAKTDAISHNLKFYNATALVKFSVSDASYTKAVFAGTNGEAVAGEATIDFGDGSSAPTITVASTATKSVEVTLSGAGTYYFAVLPGTFSNGFSITLFKGDDADRPKSVQTSRTLGRATILDMGAVDGVAAITNYFVKPDGTGSGKSWDKAMGPAQLKAFLETSSDSNVSDAKARLLDGVTIHMAAGDYDMAGNTKIEFNGYASKVAITFKGGYPTDLAATSESGRDTTAYRSAFTSSVAGSIITLGNQTDITFDGITFKDATREANGGALMAGAGESGNSSLTLTSCRFVNNRNTDEFTGAAVYLSKASANISNCYFGADEFGGGNHARNGAVINLNAGEGTVSISDCMFKGNSTFNTSGCIQNASTKTVTVTDCIFDHNTAGSYGGGAFHINATGASTSFSGCTFSNNTASGQGGAISIQTGSASFTDCVFSGNSASKGSKKNAGDGDSDVLESFAGGAIILHNANSVCTLDACTFTENSAPNGCGGAIAYENSAATLNINAGTTFSGNTAYNLGGAIFVRGAGKLNINGTSASEITFTGDHTLALGNQHANGGAIWLGESSQTTMEYVKFDGCESGQEDGSTVNYSNGGAICLKAVTSFSADNCEFTACRGRNGGVLNVEPGYSSTVTFTDCNFHDNIGRSGASKDGTAGNFHGAVARFGSTGTTTFNNCSFTDNVAYNGGGAMHTNTNNSIVCNDCTFTNNDCPNSSGGTFTMEDGTLTINGGSVRNGDSGNSAGGMIYIQKGTLNLNNTTVSDCKSASAKVGGAIYVYTGGSSGGAVTITAIGTTFSKNQCGSCNNDNDQGGAIRGEGASGKVITVNLTDCLFSGNKAKRFGTAISFNQYCVLKANRCVFSDNAGASRGTVNYGNNCLIFMNSCAFYNNTFSDATTWGLTVHGGGANAGICLNNMTAYNNRCTNGSPSTTSNVSVNGDTPLLIVNSTILDNTAYLLRANGRTLQFCNNILVNPGTAANIVHGNTSTKTSYGHNIMSGTSGADDTTDLTNCTMSTLTGGAWSSSTAASPYYGVYSWNGGASLPGFTPAVEKDVTDAIEAYTQAVSAVSVSNAGAEFKSWLESLGTSGSYGYQVDGRGVTRSGSWWPGAYQNNYTE